MNSNLSIINISVLIPYGKAEGKILVYLQKRDASQQHNAGRWGFFGGHAEKGETPDATLKREIKEELNYDLSNYQHLETQHFTHAGEYIVKHVYYFEVPSDFEQNIAISEGAYGSWLGKEILTDPELIEHDKPVLEHFFAMMV